jgi:hypothetical protein
MFTNLGSIFIRPPRQAEHADTRAEIKRHDPDQPRRQKKDEKDDEELFFDTDDTATISVPALAAFIDNFISNQTPQGANNSANPQTAPATSAPLSPAARAASAYARTDHGARPEIAAPAAPAGSSLSAADLRLMHKLRQDVQILMERRIDVLTIEKGESFLASLAASVNKILNA